MTLVWCHWAGRTTTSPRTTSWWSTPDRFERDPVAGADGGLLAHPALDGPDAGPAVARRHDHLVPGGERAAGERAGDHRAAALRREDPVDPQPGPAPVGGRRSRRPGRRRGRCAGRPSPRPESESTGTTGASSRNVPSTCSAISSAASSTRSGSARSTFVRRHDSVADVDQLEDAEVLLGLRLPSLGRRDDEHARVDGTDAGEHVPDEPHVAGHVDERHARVRSAARPRRSRGRSSGPAPSPRPSGRGRCR